MNPAPEIKEICRLHIERYKDNNFSIVGPPQYVVVWYVCCEVKDIIGYHNKNLTMKILNLTFFIEKGEYLLSAIYLQ